LRREAAGESKWRTLAAQRALGRLDPFELKDRLIAMAEEHARHGAYALLNAGRGNPDWVATGAREALFVLGGFAIEESQRAWDPRDSAGGEVGGAPRKAGIARRLRAHLARQPASPGARLLRDALRYGTARLGFDADAFAHELADGVLGDHYPMPLRMLPHAERIVREYLERELCAGRHERLELFAVEGATAGICYLFDSLQQNGLLRRGDRIALATPIFTPYVEIPQLARYAFDVVRLEASERRADGSHLWQYPDAEIDRLADPAVRALFLVNPSNPPSVALRARTVRRLVRLVRTKRPDLIVITDDVYATFVEGFRSLLAELPRNTVAVYSFSKYFGCTGWRLGVVALHEDNVLDQGIARLPARQRHAIERRYASLVLEPAKLKFIDRLVADSRQVALNHTAGLSTPQQVQMALLAILGLLGRGARYKRVVRRIVQRRLKALYCGLGAPLPADPLRAGYYCELDLMAWAERHYGREFMEFLARRHEPVDLLLRLAEQSSIVLMPGGGFAGPQWSVRVSLANLPEQAYGEIGAALHAAARGYVEEWRAAGGRPRTKGRAR
jgi:aspartate 4-decarboxylase